LVLTRFFVVHAINFVLPLLLLRAHGSVIIVGTAV
jgi:hypothetical protein